MLSGSSSWSVSLIAVALDHVAFLIWKLPSTSWLLAIAHKLVWSVASQATVVRDGLSVREGFLLSCLRVFC